MTAVHGVDSASPFVTVDRRDDGSVVLVSSRVLEDSRLQLTDYLVCWATEKPREIFLAQRNAQGEWDTLNYGTALRRVEAVAQNLIDRGLSIDRPVMILSGNSIDSAVLILACLSAGIPVAPVSPAYSLISRNYGKLRQIASQVKPGLIFAECATVFARPLAAIKSDAALLSRGVAGRIENISDWYSTEVTHAVRRAREAVRPETIAKLLFTSGSTGEPKGVLNTQLMLASNQRALAMIWPFLAAEPPVLVDWLPWHHTFGGNFTFNMVLCSGGSLYIDAGKAVPGLFETTITNLKDVAPTMYYNVPSGFAMLVSRLESDSMLRENFFKRLRLMFYAAASLPQTTWDRLEAVAQRTLGRSIPLLSGWGATETAPLSTVTYAPSKRAGVIGQPIPGTEVKCVPRGDRFELRVRGPNVTSGYWKRPDLRDAFDSEGFWITGDAGIFLDRNDPGAGIVFDGRIAEEFKLATGTWVHTEFIRLKIVQACSPVVHDAIITGHDREYLGALILLNINACKDRFGDAVVGDTLVDHAASEVVRDFVCNRISAYNREYAGSSKKIVRIVLLDEALQLDAGEITDKGSINQRAVLDQRRNLVDEIYSEAGSAIAIDVEGMV